MKSEVRMKKPKFGRQRRREGGDLMENIEHRLGEDSRASFLGWEGAAG